MITSRRKFLTASTFATMSGLLPVNSFAQQNQKWPGFIDTDEMHTVPFIDQYYDGMMSIIRGIRDTQIDNIATAVEKAYECYRDGGTLHGSCARFTHSPKYEIGKTRPGQPWLFPPMDTNRENYSKLKKGDFVLAWCNSTDKSELEARDRGVYIAGVTNPFYKFSRTPEGVLSRDQLAVEEFANIVIDSQTTWEVGLVKSPKLHFSFCPAGSTAIFIVYWAATASLANIISTKGKGSSEEPARRYLEMAAERMEWIGASRPKISYVTEEWADRVLERQARIIIYGHLMSSADPRVTSLSNVFVEEATGAGSCQMIVPYGNITDINNSPEDAEKYIGNYPDSNDIVIIGGITSDHHGEINVAREARRIGARTVAFCPFQTEDDHADSRLFKEVDYAFDTYSYERAGVFEAKDFKEKVSPLSTVTGNLLEWMLTASWADHMARRGEHPYFRQPYCYAGAWEYNQKVVLPNATKRGY